MKRITPRDASKMTVRELRQTLGSLNKLARSRIRGLQEGGFEKTVAAHKIIDPVRGMKKKDLVAAVSDVSLFLTKRRSNVTTLRKDERKTLATLHRNGFTMVNHGNLREWGEMMDKTREKHGKLRVDSDTVASIFSNMERRNISYEDLEQEFERYLNDERGLLELEKALSGADIEDGRSRAGRIRREMKKLGWYEDDSDD